MRYQPKGGMCCACKHRSEDCSSLDFSTMPAINRNTPGLTIVKCIEFEQIYHQNTPDPNMEDTKLFNSTILDAFKLAHRTQSITQYPRTRLIFPESLLERYGLVVMFSNVIARELDIKSPESVDYSELLAVISTTVLEGSVILGPEISHTHLQRYSLEHAVVDLACSSASIYKLWDEVSNYSNHALKDSISDLLEVIYSCKFDKYLIVKESLWYFEEIMDSLVKLLEQLQPE